MIDKTLEEVVQASAAITADIFGPTFARPEEHPTETDLHLWACYPEWSKEKTGLYHAARQYLEQTNKPNPRNADGLFGLIIPHLHLGKTVESRWLDELKYRLKHIPYDSQNITLLFSQVAPVRQIKAAPKEILGIFNAVLHNQGLDDYARAAIHASLQTYYLRVLRDTKMALKHGVTRPGGTAFTRDG